MASRRPDPAQLMRIMDTGTRVAHEAGNFLMQNFRSVKTVERKTDRSLVTNLDREAEAMIVGAIRGEFPEHGIIAEEGGQEGPSGSCCWIIDPLDGTHNYIKGIPVFGVSLGVVCEAEFIAGIIYMPVMDELYTAYRDGGAFKNGEPIHVSDVQILRECSLSFDSTLKDGSMDRISVLRRLGRRVFNVRMWGCSTRVLTYLAEGTIDAAVEFDDRPWDYAAGVCIVTEAGGRITRFDGAAVTLERGMYAGSNGLLHDSLRCEILSALDTEKQ